MVYLLHFDEPYHRAQHYIGFVDGDETKLQARLQRHRSGDGSRLLRAVTKAGIGFKVARTWANGDRNFERRLKNRKNSSKLCPICGLNHTTNKGGRNIVNTRI